MVENRATYATRQRDSLSQRDSPITRSVTKQSVSTFTYQSDEHGREQCEHERLQECDEQLEHHDAECGGQRYWCDEPAAEREDEADERKHDDVAGRHVREKSNRECQWLGELARELEGREQ